MRGDCSSLNSKASRERGKDGKDGKDGKGIVIPNAVRDLKPFRAEILRFAQDDTS
jgi:hypothetical protein